MGGMDKNPAPKYALVNQIQAMGGPRPFDHTDWKGKKRSSRRQISLFSLKYRIVKCKKKSHARTQMFCFPVKVLVKETKKGRGINFSNYLTLSICFV